MPKLADGMVADEGDVSEYIDTTKAVYGVYQAIAAESIVITNKADLTVLYGVYESEAKDVTLNNTGSVTTLMAAYESKVTGNVSLTISLEADGKCTMVFAALYHHTILRLSEGVHNDAYPDWEMF